MKIQHWYFKQKFGSGIPPSSKTSEKEEKQSKNGQKLDEKKESKPWTKQASIYGSKRVASHI